MKLYETYDYKTKKCFWWTQRDKNTNCYEIRQEENSKKFCLLINDIRTEIFDTFTEAEKKIKELWAA